MKREEPLLRPPSPSSLLPPSLCALQYARLLPARSQFSVSLPHLGGKPRPLLSSPLLSSPVPSPSFSLHIIPQRRCLDSQGSLYPPPVPPSLSLSSVIHQTDLSTNRRKNNRNNPRLKIKEGRGWSLNLSEPRSVKFYAWLAARSCAHMLRYMDSCLLAATRICDRYSLWTHCGLFPVIKGALCSFWDEIGTRRERSSLTE